MSEGNNTIDTQANPSGICSGKCKCGTTTLYLGVENNTKDRQDKKATERSFSELVILVVEQRPMDIAHITLYKNNLSGIQNFSLPAAGLFLRSRLRGTLGTHLYTAVRVWVPAGLRGACSGRPKSRNVLSNHGIAFRPARTNQAHATPHQNLSLIHI